MGIRFHCHHCHHELHVKDFQGGKRGRCPACQGKFRIPMQDAELSIEVEQTSQQLAVANTGQSANPTRQSNEPKRIEPAPTAKPQAAAQPTVHEAISTIERDVVERDVVERDVIERDVEEQRIPLAITEFPDGHWHVRPTSGGQYGPAPADTMAQWLIEGRVARDALVWRDDWADWQAAEMAFSDYFKSDSTPRATVPNLPASDRTTASVDIQSPATVQGTAQPILTTAGRSRLERKHKKRQRYIVTVSILTVLFIALLAALAAVLLWPSS